MEDPTRAGGPPPSIDLAALIAHARPLGGDVLAQLIDADGDALDTIRNESVPYTEVSNALTKAMVAIDEAIAPALSREARALYVSRATLGGDANCVHAHEQILLGLVLGAALQYRESVSGLSEWLLGVPLPDPGVNAPVDLKAAVADSRARAEDAYSDLLEQLRQQKPPRATPRPGHRSAQVGWLACGALVLVVAEAGRRWLRRTRVAR